MNSPSIAIMTQVVFPLVSGLGLFFEIPGTSSSGRPQRSTASRADRQNSWPRHITRHRWDGELLGHPCTGGTNDIFRQVSTAAAHWVIPANPCLATSLWFTLPTPNARWQGVQGGEEVPSMKLLRTLTTHSVLLSQPAIKRKPRGNYYHVYCLIFEARATKTPAQAKHVRKKRLTPVGLNADKLPPDSLTLSNLNSRLELFGRYRRTTMKPSVPAASSPGISFCSLFGKV